MSVLLGIGALFMGEFSNRMFRIAIVLTVICLCASQLGAGDMLHAAEQSLLEWKQFIDF
ncbi:hypothetical protein [Bacillus cereus]|uniref:hypothetical protein n=1 Tax=Bacillus cereus TaxID=1396 RepID=UPI00159BA3CB|nr:hypothetical protein [Bacillus cereus]MEC3022084.1 hypothetical protein [Bacillus cereus]MEC3259741.1 hypothetical protein [Bacillus cereus]